MSFNETIDITNYINRGVEILKNNTFLRDPVDPKKSLVTDILAQSPPIDESPNKSIIPIIYVDVSKNPINLIGKVGKDSLDVAGARNYQVEFYNVIIVRGINKQNAQEKCQKISSVVRDTYQRNQRLLDTNRENPIADENDVISVPFVLKSETTEIQAMNVICRPKVTMSLR